MVQWILHIKNRFKEGIYFQRNILIIWVNNNAETIEKLES
jgi:hypothetical protein